MPEKNNEKQTFKGCEEISIDYENIDVADIMSQIKRKISSQSKGPLQGEHLDRKDSYLYPPEFEAVVGTRSKIKNVLLRIMRPLYPLIKLLILPVYQELVENLAMTRERTDRTAENLAKTTEIRQRTKEYTKLLHNLTHNIIVELTKLKIEEENLKVKTRIIEKDLELLQKREKALEEQVFK